MRSSPPEHDPRMSELRGRLVAAVRTVCPSWLQDQADDLAHAALEKLLKRDALPDEINGGYVYRIAHSAVVDEIRRHRRRREEAMTEGDAQVETRAAGPERRAVDSETRAEIAECMTRLSEDRRRAVTLYLQGHQVPEVASLLGFTSKKAENLVYRGLSDLRACLRKKGIEP